ncbi:MAG: zinc ABC transporter substrate-binding protein, partial [Oscillospiraceae bacterium]|nr:zinc ABC transporter substrate-binding protein [Oscillospiraceae bacterium]
MKRILSILLIVALALSLSACASKNNSAAGADGGKPKIVTTIFPIYDWIRQILGDNSGAELTMLLDKGVDLHNYQPTAEDILKISTCDLFIYVGGESDEWVDDALAEAVNRDMKVINLLDALGDAVKEEEVVEGMQ